MKILVNARFLLSNQLEGIGQYTHEVMRRLVRLQPEDQFIFAFDRPYSEEFIYSDNIVPRRIFPPARHALLFWWWYHIGLAREAMRSEVDLVFSPDGFLPPATSGTKYVATIHDLAYLHYPSFISRSNLWYYRNFMPRYLKQAHQIITVSEATASDVVHHFPFTKAKVHAIHNGYRSLPVVDDDAIISLQAKHTNGKPYFFALGAMHPRKNIVRLLRAYERFRSHVQGVYHLIIVGRRAWQTGDITRQLSQSAFRNDIHMLDHQSDDIVSALLKGSQGLVYPSLFEGFGLPIVEAMSLSVPVLTSDRSAMAEIAGDAAIKVDPESEESIADGLLRLCDSELAEKLRKKGKQRCVQFSWDLSATQHSNIFRSLLQNVHGEDKDRDNHPIPQRREEKR